MVALEPLLDVEVEAVWPMILHHGGSTLARPFERHRRAATRIWAAGLCCCRRRAASIAMSRAGHDACSTTPSILISNCASASVIELFSLEPLADRAALRRIGQVSFNRSDLRAVI